MIKPGIVKVCELDETEWHPWFAWYPVWFDTIYGDGRVCETRAWWITIERRCVYHWGSWDWCYRIIP